VSGFFRRRVIFQQQTTIGGFGRAGAAGAAGAAGPAGAAGAAGSDALGPSQQQDRSSAEINAAFVTPLDTVTAIPGSRIIPLMCWTESNVTVAGTNASAYQWSWAGIAAMASYSALLSTARNTGTRDTFNLTSETAAINVALPSTGRSLQISLTLAPTGAPTVTTRTWCLYFAIPGLI